MKSVGWIWGDRGGRGLTRAITKEAQEFAGMESRASEGPDFFSCRGCLLHVKSCRASLFLYVRPHGQGLTPTIAVLAFNKPHMWPKQISPPGIIISPTTTNTSPQPPHDNHSTTIHQSTKSAKMPNAYAPLSLSFRPPRYMASARWACHFSLEWGLFGRPARFYFSWPLRAGVLI